MYWQLTDHFIVSADIDRTWAFFADAENLPAITPPWLAFTILTPRPFTIADGSLLDYTIRWAGVPIRWRTKIIDWTPPRQFIDLQIRGPYALWHHQHTFTPTPQGVACTDRVIYKLPVPGVDRIVHATVVGKQLIEIFRFRRTVISERLGWVNALQADIEIKPL